jgi:hypothetical protein
LVTELTLSLNIHKQVDWQVWNKPVSWRRSPNAQGTCNSAKCENNRVWQHLGYSTKRSKKTRAVENESTHSRLEVLSRDKCLRGCLRGNRASRKPLETGKVKVVSWSGERLASETQAYSTKLVHKKMGSRALENPPAPTPYAHNAAQGGFTATDYDIWRMAQAFSVGCAETAPTGSQKNHHKKT